MSDPVDWASDANFPAGSDPWSGQPTKVAPTSGQIAAGVRPKWKLPGEWFNWLINNITTAVRTKQDRPAGAVVDNRASRWDGTSKVLQSSDVEIDDSGNVDTPGNVSGNALVSTGGDIQSAANVTAAGYVSATGECHGLFVTTSSLGTGTPGANSIYADLVAKAWGFFSFDGVGNVTMIAGSNISGFVAGTPQAIGTAYLTVDFLRAFVSAQVASNYQYGCLGASVGSAPFAVGGLPQSQSQCRVYGDGKSFNTDACALFVAFYGRQ